MSVNFDPAKIAEAANADGEFQVVSHLWNARVRLDVGDQSYLLEVRDGKIVELAPRDKDKVGPCNYRIYAPRSDWEEFLKPAPRPFYQDLNAAIWRHEFRFEGEALDYYPYYRALNRIFEIMRQA